MINKNKKLAFKVIILSALVVGLSFCGNNILRDHQRRAALEALRAPIEEAISNYPELDCSFLIKDLKFRNAMLANNETSKFAAASLLKLPILAAAFNAISEGQMALNTIVAIKRKDITGGSGKLKGYKLPFKLSIGKLLELMISASDNTATNKIISILGRDYINEEFIKTGLKDTHLARPMMDFSQRKNGVENYTSSRDIASILEKIYDRKLINATMSDLALSFLKKQKVNDRLPRYLPKNTVIAHKTGLEKGTVHDAGIVFAPGGDYIICVLTGNSRGYQKPKKLIAQISLLAYNLYLSSN